MAAEPTYASAAKSDAARTIHRRTGALLREMTLTFNAETARQRREIRRLRRALREIKALCEANPTPVSLRFGVLEIATRGLKGK